MLELSAVHKSFSVAGGEQVSLLDGIDFSLEPGTSAAILGRSGSGKSTLLNVLGLLDVPDRGSYRVDGVATGTLRDGALARMRGERFGFVFQNFYLLDGRTALANVAAPLLHATGEEFRARHQRAEELLKLVGLADRARSTPSLLSGGEQQRVAIGRAIARHPRYVLADEPTGALDEQTGQAVLDLLMGLVANAGCGLVIVTHDDSVAARADRRYLLGGGKLERIH